jgi:hypothetical protein
MGQRQPVIVPGQGVTASPSVYQGGNYGELETQSITGFVVGPAISGRGGGVYGGAGEPSIEMSGSPTGAILARGMARSRRRERRHRLRSFLWITFGLLAFMTAIVVVVDILAGDFIRSIFRTFASFAG